MTKTLNACPVNINEPGPNSPRVGDFELPLVVRGIVKVQSHSMHQCETLLVETEIEL